MHEMDFTWLEGRDAYALYFNHLGEVFSRLTDWYGRRAATGNHEARIVSGFLDRLLDTVRALRLKYTHHPSHSLKVDVTDSGFPCSLELIALQTDLERRGRALRDMPTRATLKRQCLDFMFGTHQEPSHLLWRLCEREYLEMLSEDRLFTPFARGRLERVRSERADGSTRSYALSWGCFDYATSRPYVHVMSFDCPGSDPALETSAPAREELWQAVEREGSRAPGVGVLATALDGALPRVHPKILKRIAVGPLFSRFLVEHQEESVDPLWRSLAGLLRRHGRREDDFVLFFDDEIVFSKRQEITRGLFSAGGTAREIFHIPESDPDCYRRRASVVHRHVMLPHHLLQHAEDAGAETVRALAGCTRIPYTDDGVFHGIPSQLSG